MGLITTIGNQGGVVLATFTTGQINTTSLYMTQPVGYSKLTFQAIGGATVTTVTVYATIDPAAIQFPGGPPVATYPAPGAAGGYWFAINPGAQAASPADVVNPFTNGNGSQYFPMAGYSAVAFCAQSGGTQTGTTTVLLFATT